MSVYKMRWDRCRKCNRILTIESEISTCLLCSMRELVERLEAAHPEVKAPPQPQPQKAKR